MPVQVDHAKVYLAARSNASLAPLVAPRFVTALPHLDAVGQGAG
jgi:hypothetical protein